MHLRRNVTELIQLEIGITMHKFFLTKKPNLENLQMGKTTHYFPKKSEKKTDIQTHKSKLNCQRHGIKRRKRQKDKKNQKTKKQHTKHKI